MLDWLERNRSNLALALVVLATVAGTVVLQLPRRPPLQVVSSPAGGLPPIKVHVIGAVRSPGVYPLAADARMEDALKAAGGPSDLADVGTLNLATPLRDGQQVVVPQAGAAPAPSTPATSALAARSAATPSSQQPSTRLDLNSASRAELEALPGIGPVGAGKILDYRTKNGRFVSVDELKEAKLVNNPTFERIREMVEVR